MTIPLTTILTLILTLSAFPTNQTSRFPFRSAESPLGIYNKFGLIQANPLHNFSVLRFPEDSSKFDERDFSVTWPSGDEDQKDHSFF